MASTPQSVHSKLHTRVRNFAILYALLYATCTLAHEPTTLGNPAEKLFEKNPTPSNIQQTTTEIQSPWENPAPPTTNAWPDWNSGPTLNAPILSTPPIIDNTTPTTQPGFPPGLPHGFPNEQQGLAFYDPNVGAVYAHPYVMNAYTPFGPYSGYSDPMMMTMAQQMLFPPFPQNLNILNDPEQNREHPEDGAASEKKGEDKPGSEWTMQRLVPLKVSSPLGETLWSCVKTLSPFHTPTGPDKGCGQPLGMRSWQDHPYYFGGFVGSMSGSQLVKDMIDQGRGSNGGLKLGYSFNDYWGVEGRLHFASLEIRETSYGREVYDAWYSATYPDIPYRPLTTRSNQLTLFDVSVQYYPLGNAKWRPFFTYGLGVVRESFSDTFGVKNRVNTLTMPLGLGLRYWWNERLSLQMDLVDNIIFSVGQVRTQGNVALTVGISYSFGTNRQRRPTAYWPYSPSTGTKW